MMAMWKEFSKLLKEQPRVALAALALSFIFVSLLIGPALYWVLPYYIDSRINALRPPSISTEDATSRTIEQMAEKALSNFNDRIQGQININSNKIHESDQFARKNINQINRNLDQLFTHFKLKPKEPILIVERVRASVAERGTASIKEKKKQDSNK